MAIKLHSPEDHPITCFYSHASGRGVDNEETPGEHVFSSYDAAELAKARGDGQYSLVINLRKKSSRTKIKI